MAVINGGAAPRAIALVLAGLLAGCAAGPRSAADCSSPFRNGTQFAASLGTTEASDLPAGLDCAYSAPAAVNDPAAPAVDDRVPAAEPEPPKFWPEVGPRLFVPTG
jgi:hypothetical protein